MRIKRGVLACLIGLALAAATCPAAAFESGPVKMGLEEVQYWAYNIQGVNTQTQRDQLTNSHFDLYVLEPVVTEQGEEAFDIAALVRDIRQHNITVRGIDPLILAYIDIGQVETWRWYYEPGWQVGDPAWIVGLDPDGWTGCLPVAYWHQEWQKIVIYGHQGRSHVEETLKAGFDGIYMDWVEGFSDEHVVARAEAEGIEPATAIFDFIARIGDYARFESPRANPDYLIVAQNAANLYQADPERYQELIDAIALEGIWYDGTGGFDDWNAPDGYNVRTNDIYPGYTEEVLAWLAPMKPHLPIFCVEYAQDVGDAPAASEVYQTLAPAQGFTAYCSRRSLAQLSTTPYPPGYEPRDY